MLQRQLLEKASELLTKYPMIAVTGPRQSGKTTFCRMLRPNFQYLNMELEDVKEKARRDPRNFLEVNKGGVILDEVQNVPELFPYLQYYTDLRGLTGEYILSGSQHFLLLEKITQSLAGRIGIFNLQPFSLQELENSGWELDSWQGFIQTGFYPRLYHRGISPQDFYPDYVQTYLERDVRQITNVNNLGLFRSFLAACAGRIGQLLNLTQFGNDLGIDAKTVKNWLSILEASFIVYRLQPYYKNFTKRIVKMPKLYFYDVGLASYLLGIRSSLDVNNHFAKGALFENFIINEIQKNEFNRGERPLMYFWRDNHHNEIDLIIDRITSRTIIEIKAGKTIHESFFKNLHKHKKASSDSPKSFLIYGGDQPQLGTETQVLTWQNLSALL